LQKIIDDEFPTYSSTGLKNQVSLTWLQDFLAVYAFRNDGGSPVALFITAGARRPTDFEPFFASKSAFRADSSKKFSNILKK
jgi:hypothetical protein